MNLSHFYCKDLLNEKECQLSGLKRKGEQEFGEIEVVLKKVKGSRDEYV